MDSLLDLALQEDLGELGDITSNAIFSEETDTFHLVSKDTGILCGLEEAKRILFLVDSSVEILSHYQDGDAIGPGMSIAKLTGLVCSILTAERTMLNCMSHLSGIATKTRQYAQAATPAIILDTRKTIPGLRSLQKYAVTCGGGQNHRIGLYDMVLIKDNHIDAAGGIRPAVERIHAVWGDRFPIEVETRNLLEVKEALACKVQRIMFDNMADNKMREAVALVAGVAETEASGNITLERLPEIAKTGVNFISVGGLTHTVKAFDFSLIKGV